MPVQVLVVAAHRKRRHLLTAVLRAHKFQVQEGPVGESLLESVASFRPDIVVLTLPDAGVGHGTGPEAGLALLRELREQAGVPVIVLATAAGAPGVVPALQSGADDYLTWPVHVGELVSRMRAILRRVARTGYGRGSRLVAGGGAVVIDLFRRTVSVRGRPVELSLVEWRVLATLAANAGRVLTHDELLTRALGLTWRGDVQWLRVLISRLRRKLGGAEGIPPVLHTRFGVGYLLIAEPAEGDTRQPDPSAESRGPASGRCGLPPEC